ncbi:MAG: glycosyltransferase family 39 protein [Candidatus Eisenbacteria bacterium]|nr:glycosyltransferase family 39 protein [Candidatus Eisenbacteria bacterium]
MRGTARWGAMVEPVVETAREETQRSFARVPLPRAWSGRRRETGVLLAVMLYLAVTLSLYIGRLTFIHEEPRRAIVAQEMIQRGDYIAPTVFHRPYFKKPPFHNWLIALSALPSGRVTERGARSVSVIAFLALGALVYASLRRTRPELALPAALMTLTSYLTACEYGNWAEPDMLLGLLGFLAYFFYMKEPRRPLSFALSVLFMGMGILTKGVLPLFFYPGLLVWLLTGGAPRGRAQARALGLLGLHLVLALAVAGAWAGALWMRGDLGKLLHTGVTEIADKSTGTITHFLTHLAVYPVRIGIVLLPWTLAVALAFRRARSGDRMYRSSFWIALTSLLALVVASGSRDRYILPAVPFLAIVGAWHFDRERPVAPWLGRVTIAFLGLVCAAAIVMGIRLGYTVPVIVMAAALVALAWLFTRRFRALELALIAALFIVTGYEHGIYYDKAERKGNYDALVSAIAERADASVPLVVDEGVPMIHLAFYLEAGLGRPVYGSGVAKFDRFFLLTTPKRAKPGGKEILRVSYPRNDVGEIIVQELGPTSAREGEEEARRMVEPAIR